MSKKIFLLIFFVFFLTNSKAKQLTNNVIVSIDNSIITELDINKEINFLKFVNKDQATGSSEPFKKEIINMDQNGGDLQIYEEKILIYELAVENIDYFYEKSDTNS